MLPEIEKYQRLRDLGWTPVQVCQAVRSDGVGATAAIGLLRKLFSLSLREAKEITLVSAGSVSSLEDFQGRLLPELKKILVS